MTKQHILNEIKRTATANGGKALGRARFFTETGIKESDWSGRYWTTWSAALAEAGFPPNRLNGAYNNDLLLQRLCELVRDLGRFPVAAEFRLRRRTDPTFPDQKTYRRFGRKGALARQLRDYSLANGLEEVAALCEPHIDEESPAPSPRSETVLGDVYLIKAGRHYKIGRSNAAGRRERELAIQLPERAVRIHTIRTDDPAGIEEYWHRRFADRRKNGEWFALTAADVASFRRRKVM